MNKTTMWLLSASLPALMMPTATLAQDASPQAEAGIQEIVVTATRRAERLQDVPVAVTALTSAALETKQVTDVLTLAPKVPGMQSNPTLNMLEITVAIRGVSQLNATIAQDPSIGTYVDGVYNVVNAGSNNALIDMERVEVLKGPQGTLFGRNTIGGAINISTARPQDKFGGYVKATAGNYKAWSGTGVVNVPISPGVLDSRFVYQHDQHGGYGKNRVTGNPTASYNSDYVRGSLLFTPAPGSEILLSGFYTDVNGNSAATKLGYFSDVSPLNGLYPLVSGVPGDLMTNYVNRGKYQDAYTDLDSRFGLKQYGFTGTATVALGEAVSVKSITAYINTDYQRAADLDGTPYAFLQSPSYPIEAKQFSQELQLYGDALDSKLHWITGAYYFQVTGDQPLNLIALPNLSPPASRVINISGPRVKNRSYSAFAQITYEIVEDVRLTGGLRYVVDKRKAVFRDRQENLATGAFVACSLAHYPFGTDPTLCTYTNKVKYDYIPWTVGLDYKPNANTLVYAKVSQGFRSGAYPDSGPQAVGASPTLTSAQAAIATAANLAAYQPVAPEKLISPEVGVKLDLLDRRLRINLAGYYSRYNNIQLPVILPPACTGCAPLGVLRNSGKADIWGGEIEVTALLGKLQIDLAAGYTDPKYLAGSPNFGQPVVKVSKFNGSVSANYPIDLGGNTLTLNSLYAYRSKTSLSAIQPNEAPASILVPIQKGFGLLSARASLDFADLPLTLAIYGQNLTDKKYKVAATTAGPPINRGIYFPGAPLTFGASATYRF